MDKRIFDRVAVSAVLPDVALRRFCGCRASDVALPRPRLWVCTYSVSTLPPEQRTHLNRHFISHTMSSPPKYTAYGATNGGEDAGASEPLLGESSSSPQKTKGMAGFGADDFAAATLAAQAGSSRNAWMDQPAEDDIPDDFKIGVVVADCDEAIRRAFLRKVYAILLCQLALTAAVSGALMFPGPAALVQNNPWIIFVSIICSFISLFGVYWKRHNYPANMLVLTAFTFFESIMIGSTCSFYDAKIVSSPTSGRS